MIGLHSGHARLALPVSGALVLGVGVGSAIGWVAGGADPASAQHQAVTGATVASVATASMLTGVRRVKPSQEPEAVGLLRRAAVARTAIPWSGTQVVTTWSTTGTTTRMVDLSHEPGEGTAARVRATVADDEDLTFVPDGDGPDAAPDLDSSGPLSLLTRTYALRSGGTQVVAGRSADQVVALRTDGTVAARFWVDQDSGLLLRRELVDPHGGVTHSSLFVDVQPGVAGSLVEGADVTRPWTTEISHAQLVAMRGSGWTCPDSLPGGLELYDMRRTPSATDPVVHLAYSDGLVNVSVFEERGHLDSAALDGFARETLGGRAVHVRRVTAEEVTWQSGDTVYTVVADAPESSVAAVVSSLPAPSGGTRGGWSRVRHGLHRMGSWVDPRS